MAAKMKQGLWVGVMLATLAWSMPAWAHIGPPYPIMQNRKVGPLNVEVWSNPDVGTGSFFVILDAPKGSMVPPDIRVEVAVQPLSHRLPEQVYGAWREKLKDRVEYKTVVPFDKEEMWHVRILLSSAVVGETNTDVAVTPTLLGRWDLLLYLLPFLGIGFLWFRGMRQVQKRRTRNAGAPRGGSQANLLEATASSEEKP